MSKQFVKGNIYVFTKKAFLKGKRNLGINRADWCESKEWVNEINGRKVDIGQQNLGDINGYTILPKWCKCIKKGV